MSREVDVSKHKRTLKSGKTIGVKKHKRKIPEIEQFDPLSEDWVAKQQAEEIGWIIQDITTGYCPNCQAYTIHEIQTSKNPGLKRSVCDQCGKPNNPGISIKDIEKISNKEYLLGDLDNDNIKNIDDPTPFIKSKKSVEETKLSDTLIQIDNLYIQDKKKMNKIVKDFQNIVAETKGVKQKNVKKITQHRVKTPISTLNKAYERGIGEVHDKLGMRYIGNNYNDLSKLRGELLKNYELINHKDYYKSKRPDNYKAIHLFVRDNKNNALVEIQLNTKRVRRLGDINHTLYKEKRQNIDEFSRLMDVAESADNGNKQDAKYLDCLTDKQIKEMLTLGD